MFNSQTHEQVRRKGAKPGELSVERSAKFQLIFNLKTAKQIGVIIPPNLLARAYRVIR